MKLVISEKPSVGQSLAAVLGATVRRDGYLEGNGYLVSWCVGHLAELADAETYDAQYAKWRKEDLPILPAAWRFSVSPSKRKQFSILQELLRRDDISEVINACDAGREGELIFRTVYTLAGCYKPVQRLWISSMEDSAIREGFRNLRPGKGYDGLYQAALCRGKADWLVGINATRLFSVTYGQTLRIGRVVSPTLALIVQREAEIAAFVPQSFYTVELACGGTVFSGERIDTKSDGKAIAEACSAGTLTIQTVERREKAERAPALYDLTTLQRDANRLLNYTAQQTLDYLQSLYEKKLCTYPRTDSRYLTADMEKSVPDLVSAAAAVCRDDVPKSLFPAQVCDSAKVSDHHAVVPTKEAEHTDLAALPTGEQEILRLISKEVLRAVSPPYRYTDTTVTAECAGHCFTAKGKTVLELGWRTYGDAPKDAVLPECLAEGQTLPVESAALHEGKTIPAKHYTEDTLLSAMETAGAAEAPENADQRGPRVSPAKRASWGEEGQRNEADACPKAGGAERSLSRRGIGTPATRAGIMEKLVSSGLVERKKAKKVTSLLPTKIGEALIAVLPEALQSPLLTAEWEHRLAEVERGELEPEEFMDGITALVKDLVATYRPVPGAEALFPSGQESVGPCPRCGGDVLEREKGFFCANRACRLALWKENRFFAAKRKRLTKEIASALLREGSVILKGCRSERTGKTYDAMVFLEDDGEKAGFRMEFPHG